MRRRLAAAALLLAWAPQVAALEVRVADPDLPTFRSPFDFAPAAEGGVAVLEDLEGVVRLAAGGTKSQALPAGGAPRLVAADESGLLLVLEGTSAVAAYRKGREAWRVRLQGEVRPSRPSGMAARNGLLWLVERSPARALLYAFDGKQVAVADLRPWARSPFSVALGPKGEAYVTDPLGPAVVTLSPAGSYTGALNLGGTGVTRPTGVALDGGGRVWVSDGVTGILACFDAGGAPVAVRAGGKAPRLRDPLRLGWARGALWVLEGRTGRVKRVDWEEP